MKARKPNNLSSPEGSPQFAEISDDISDMRAFDIPAIIIFLILLFIVALQFFTRYVLNDSIGWSEEIARYFLILLGFSGSIICVRKGTHIFLEFSYRYFARSIFKPPIFKSIVVLTESLIMGFWSYTAWLAFELAMRTKSNMVSVALPKSIIYYIVFAACLAMALSACRNWLKIIGTPAETVRQNRLSKTD